MIQTSALHTIADAERARERRGAYAIARETFEYIDRSVGRVTINRGEMVCLGHEAIAQHPEMFDGVGLRSRGRASHPELNSPRVAATPVRDDELPRPSWALESREPGLLAADGDVELRDTTSPIKVRLSSYGARNLRRYADAVPRDFETGGLLIAARASTEFERKANLVHISDVWRPGPATRHKRSSVALDWRAEHARARQHFSATDTREVLAGCWHTHPGGSDRPSSKDLQMFGAAMADANRSVYPMRHYVAIIATDADLGAWVVRRERGERSPLICERAAIVR